MSNTPNDLSTISTQVSPVTQTPVIVQKRRRAAASKLKSETSSAPAPVVVNAAAAAGELVTPKKKTKNSGKGPGRPRKEVSNANFEINGISDHPILGDDNTMEFVYHNPGMFKRLVNTLFKQYNVVEIYFEFTNTGIFIVAMDHAKITSIRVSIDGCNVPHYFCSANARVGVKLDVLGRCFKHLNSKCGRMEIVQRAEDNKSKLYLTLVESHADPLNYVLDLIPYREIPIDPNDENYPLQFTFSSVYLKQYINIMYATGHTFTISKTDGYPLEISPSKEKVGGLALNRPFLDPEKIKLRCDLEPYHIFIVTLAVNTVRPFTNASIGDEVTIRAHKDQRISFTTYIDKVTVMKSGEPVSGHACVMKIFTNLMKIEDQTMDKK